MVRLSLGILLVSFFITGCKLKKETTSSTKLSQQPDVFEVAEGNALFSIDNNLDDSLQNKRVILKGEIHDTGALNMFYIYNANNSNIISSRFFLDKRIFKDKFSLKWVKLEGFYLKTGKFDAELSVDNIQELDDMQDVIQKAISYSTKWVAENRGNFDLNEYKNTQRFKKAFYSFKNKDLNASIFVSDSTVTFIDFENKLIGVNCGHHILRKSEQRSDFLCFHAIYDYEHDILLRVLIQNTGSFLE